MTAHTHKKRGDLFPFSFQFIVYEQGIERERERAMSMMMMMVLDVKDKGKKKRTVWSFCAEAEEE